MLFNFYLAPDCTVCHKIWPSLKILLEQNKIEYKTTSVQQKNDCDSCRVTDVEFNNNGIPNKPIFSSIYDDNNIEIAKERIPAFPAMGIVLNNQPFVICGDGILDLVNMYIKDKNQFISHINSFSKSQ